MKNNRGVTLVALALTVSIMAILVAITSTYFFNDEGTKEQARISVFTNDVAILKQELDTYIIQKKLVTNGKYNSEELYADSGSHTYKSQSVENETIVNIIPSITKEEYLGMLEVQAGKLVYTGSDDQYKRIVESLYNPA